MTVAQFVIDFLASRGVDTAFLVQGAANNDLIYAIADHPKMRYVCAMHEQAAGFMAEGWARVKGLPGLAIATSGPGGQNLVTPIANCYYESVPCIFITGQVNSKFLRPNAEIRQLGFQETPIVDIVMPITKYAVMLREVSRLPDILKHAWKEASSGRPGPVLLDLPLDVQKTGIS